MTFISGVISLFVKNSITWIPENQKNKDDETGVCSLVRNHPAITSVPFVIHSWLVIVVPKTNCNDNKIENDFANRFGMASRSVFPVRKEDNSEIFFVLTRLPNTQMNMRASNDDDWYPVVIWSTTKSHKTNGRQHSHYQWIIMVANVDNSNYIIILMKWIMK